MSDDDVPFVMTEQQCLAIANHEGFRAWWMQQDSLPIHEAIPKYIDELQDKYWREEGMASAATEAWFAFDRLRNASNILSGADAAQALNSAMSDLASWLPGYDAETGEIKGGDA